MWWHIFRNFSRPKPKKEEEKEQKVKGEEAAQIQLLDAIRDPSQSLMICAGTDNFLKIGEPQGANQRTNTSIEQLWKEEVERTFKKMPTEEGSEQITMQ